MINERKIHAIEFTVIILLWTLVFISPLLFMDDFKQDWVAVHVMWVECVVVGFAFLINRFVLMPRFFLVKKYAEYISSLIILFLLLAIFVIYFDIVNAVLTLFGEGTVNSSPPSMGAGNTPPPNMMPQRPPYGMPMQGGSMPAMPSAGSVIPPSIVVLIASAITIALDMGLSLSIKWIISEQKQAEINRERIAAQLSNLQSQVSPHFFMNTLNNIHALVDIDSQRAKQTIIELSALMDYLIYESSNKEKVALQRELDFVSSYVSLMRLRYPDQVKIDFSYGKSMPSVKIPPLLFLNFIENAFKYGIDYDSESFIKIDFIFSYDIVGMSVVNSNHSQNVNSPRHGLGISNSRKRLKLLYGNKFSLEIADKEDIYSVNLKIPIL